MASIGQLHLMEAREKKDEKGVTLSRARVHHIRPTCSTKRNKQLAQENRHVKFTVILTPIVHKVTEMNTMSKRPKVPPLLPVA